MAHRELSEILFELHQLSTTLESQQYIREASDLRNVYDMIRTGGGVTQRFRKTAKFSLPDIPVATKHLSVPTDEQDFYSLMKHLGITIPDYRGPFPGIPYLIECMGDFENQLRQRGYSDYSLTD